MEVPVKGNSHAKNQLYQSDTISASNGQKYRHTTTHIYGNRASIALRGKMGRKLEGRSGGTNMKGKGGKRNGWRWSKERGWEKEGMER